MSSEALRFLQEAKKEDNIEDIYLDDIEIKKLDGALLKELESMMEIICLSMNGCKLQTLQNFPKLPKLVRLELIENEFEGQDIVHLGHLGVIFTSFNFTIQKQLYLTTTRNYNLFLLAATKLESFVSLMPLKTWKT